MRKLTQALLIALGCFSAAGVYASCGSCNESEESSEVVVGTEEEGEDTSSQRVFQQEDDEDLKD